MVHHRDTEDTEKITGFPQRLSFGTKTLFLSVISVPVVEFPPFCAFCWRLIIPASRRDAFSRLNNPLFFPWRPWRLGGSNLLPNKVQTQSLTPSALSLTRGKGLLLFNLVVCATRSGSPTATTVNGIIHPVFMECMRSSDPVSFLDQFP